jgi:hypothetical protein
LVRRTGYGGTGLLQSSNLDWNIVCANLDIVDKVIAKVNGSWKILRALHHTINNESDVMSSRADMNNSSKKGRITFTVMKLES